MNDKIIITLISSGLVFLLGVLKLTFPYLKQMKNNAYKRKLQKVGLADDDQYEIIIDIARKYGFNYSLLCKWHNGGHDMDVMSVKKITVIKEYTLDPILPKKKPFWESRTIDREFNRTIHDLIADDYLHFTDLEHVPANTGLRKLLNINHGLEVLLVELGTHQPEYYFMVFQRDLKIKEDREKPIYLASKHIEIIKYLSSNIWKIAKRFLS
jgi:hypothetical protein